MSEGLKLLQELKSGSYQAGLFASYNVSFPFFEQVVLRALRSHGCDHNVLLMDAAQCQTNLTDVELAPRGAGRLYGLGPVAAPGVFHPKFMLLLGKRQSKLMLGSHNLTLSGFGLNREITNALTIADRASEALAQSVFQFALAWAATVGEELVELINSARNWVSWLGTNRKPPADIAVLGTLPSGPSLWDQLRDQLADDVTQVAVMGPYFDERLEFLSVLREEFPEAKIAVGVSPRSSEINPACALKTDIVFKDLSGWQGDTADRVVHAKLMLFTHRSGESVLVSGSANPSAPAWLDGKHRNAELVLVRRLAKSDPLPDGLGMLEIPALPEMSDAAWAVVRERREASIESDREMGKVWLAFAQEDGLLVDEAFANQDEEVLVYDREDEVLASVKAPESNNGRRLLAVVDDEVRSGATRLQVPRGEAVHIALVQHLAELRDRATSEKRRSLRQALFDLDTKDEGIDGYLAIIEKAIFDSDPVPREMGSSPSLKRSPIRASQRSVGVGELEKKGRRRPRLNTGDIGLVLDALVYKLGEGLPSEGSVARLSEEDIEDETELPPLPSAPPPPPGKRAGRSLAEQSRAKIRTMMRRMAKRLVAAWNEEVDAFSVLVQLVATLGLLHRLTMRREHFKWLPRGTEMIPPAEYWNLVKEAAVVVFAPENGFADMLEESHGEFAELSSAAALILWSARECELDLATALAMTSAFEEVNEAGDEEENLLGLGVLLNCLNRDRLPPISELSLLFDDEGLEWLERHLDWAEDMSTAPPNGAQAACGTVVRFQRSAAAALAAPCD